MKDAGDRIVKAVVAFEQRVSSVVGLKAKQGKLVVVVAETLAEVPEIGEEVPVDIEASFFE